MLGLPKPKSKTLGGDTEELHRVHAENGERETIRVEMKRDGVSEGIRDELERDPVSGCSMLGIVRRIVMGYQGG